MDQYTEAETMVLIEKAFDYLDSEARGRIIDWMSARWVTPIPYRQKPEGITFGEFTYAGKIDNGIFDAPHQDDISPEDSPEELLSCAEDAGLVMGYLRSGNDHLIKEAHRLLEDEHFKARVMRGGFEYPIHNDQLNDT